MSNDTTFLRALHANPADNSLRLVYADWLDDRGDPRAAYLRLDVAWHEGAAGDRPADLAERLHRARSRLDPRWLALVDRPLPGWRIVRTGAEGKTYGKAIPAFIHNFSYHLSPIDVYSDGVVDCWGFVDLPLFRRKLAEGWVVPRAEIGGTLGIHNLGQARVAAAVWEHTPADIEQQVTDVVRELNPRMEGLIDMQGTDTEERNGIRYGKGSGWGAAVPYRINLAGDEVSGAELPVLEVTPGGYRLRHWMIHADGLTQLGYATELLPLEAVGRMFDEGRLALSVPAGAWVAIDGLGRFQAGEGSWWVKPAERVREAADLLDQLNGGPGARHRCIEAHQEYESDPSPERREALRVAYEAVPEHLRMYCGDMDSKDGPIRHILYGPGGGDDSE